MSKAKFDKAVSIVQNLPKEGPIQPTQDEQLFVRPVASPRLARGCLLTRTVLCSPIAEHTNHARSSTSTTSRVSPRPSAGVRTRLIARIYNPQRYSDRRRCQHFQAGHARLCGQGEVVRRDPVVVGRWGHYIQC